MMGDEARQRRRGRGGRKMHAALERVTLGAAADSDGDDEEGGVEEGVDGEGGG